MVHKGGLARWSECFELAERRQPDDEWRPTLARRLREAIGCTYVTVHTFAGAPAQSTWPDDYTPLMDEMRLRFLPRIEAAGEGAEFALRRYGRVYAPLEVTRCEALEHDIRGFLRDADVEGYCVTFLGSAESPLDGLVVIGDERGDAVLLDRAGPGLLGLASMRARHAAPTAPLTGLTAREKEIAGLLADGLSKLNIAARLEISEQTVVVHARSIYRKLGVHNRVDLARRVGLTSRRDAGLMGS